LLVYCPKTTTPQSGGDREMQHDAPLIGFDVPDAPIAIGYLQQSRTPWSRNRHDSTPIYLRVTYALRFEVDRQQGCLGWARCDAQKLQAGWWRAEQATNDRATKEKAAQRRPLPE
jgi:hypothetical protein